MTRAIALLTLAAATLRLAGGFAVAVSREIDRMVGSYQIEIPPQVLERMWSE